MVRTLLFVLAGVVVQTLLGYLIASLLLKVQRYRAFLLGPILIPSVISSVVAGWQGRMIFNASYGPLNDVLAHIGIKGPAWLALPQTALVSVFLTDTWQWTPFLALIILAALQSQPLELLEAARLDGARGWSLFRRITLPLILPVAGVGVLLRGVDLFKTFDLVYILTQGGPGNSSETLTFLTYLQGFKFFNPSYASAMSFIQLIVITIVAKGYLGLMNRRGAI
jgi:multiple sugar transport system permease protein